MNKLTFVVCVLLLAFAAAYLAEEEIIKIVNNSPLKLWKAKSYTKFADKTFQDLKNMFLQYPKYLSHKQSVLTEKELLLVKEQEAKRRTSAGNPDNFDSREQWKNLKCNAMINPQDQGHCGSCWAFSASEALGSRFCIASNGTVNKIMSAQDLVSCDHFNFGCKGGMPMLAYHYMDHTGVVDAECMPYEIGGYSSCPSKCRSSSDPLSSRKYHLKTYNHIQNDITAIESEILKNGPVSVDFTVYNDFLSYSSGVYHHVSGAQLGGHAVLAVGWGVDSVSKSPYWIIQNSWGPKWGINGFFWMLKGRNECGIERDVYAGTPDLGRIPKN